MFENPRDCDTGSGSVKKVAATEDEIVSTTVLECATDGYVRATGAVGIDAAPNIGDFMKVNTVRGQDEFFFGEEVFDEAGRETAIVGGGGDIESFLL
jgi:hypothetical protein